MVVALLVGLFFGFAGSIPIAGPTAAVVVSRGLEHRTRPALYVAIGAALPEAMYAFLAFWGLMSLMGHFPHLVPLSRLIGSGVVIGLGVYFLVHRIRRGGTANKNGTTGGLRDLLLGFTMTIANPTLIVTWTLTIGIAHSTGLLRVDGSDALPFAVGVGAGIVGWFSLLVVLLERSREHVSVEALDRVVHAMGVILIVSGVGLGARVMATWR